MVICQYFFILIFVFTDIPFETSTYIFVYLRSGRAKQNVLSALSPFYFNFEKEMFPTPNKACISLHCIRKKSYYDIGETLYYIKIDLPWKMHFFIFNGLITYVIRKCHTLYRVKYFIIHGIYIRTPVRRENMTKIIFCNPWVFEIKQTKSVKNINDLTVSLVSRSIDLSPIPFRNKRHVSGPFKCT